MKTDYQNKQILVVGAGQSGRALARFFAARGAHVTLSDQRPVDQLTGISDLSDLPIEFDCGGHNPALFAQADLIAVSPGVPLTSLPLQPAISRHVPILGEIEIAGRELDAPLIAVTGTNGKSTTTSLIGEALRGCRIRTFVGGNLGTPLIEAVDQGDKVLVVELSSFQLETIERFHPQIAVLLNLSPDHLDRYADLESYYRAKINLFRNMNQDDFAVLNADDPQVCTLCADIAATKVWFSPEGRQVEGLVRRGHRLYWAWHSAQEEFDLDQLLLPGEHNVENAMAALTTVLLQGCPPQAAWKAICHFAGLEHRMQLVRILNGVKWYNDSKGTNVGSVLKSLAGLDYPVTLIAGGKDKGGDYALLRPLLEQKVKCLILIGEARQRMEEAFAGCCDIIVTDDLEAAVTRAHQLTETGGTVLLSPACSSFDMFTSYQHRGAMFEQLVRALDDSGGER